MEKIAVFNETHGVSYQIACWMLRDLGYKVFVAGKSFCHAVHAYYRGSYAPWTGTDWCCGVMEWKDMPKDALFLDTFPETEQKLRNAGWNGPYLLHWIVPCGTDFILDTKRSHRFQPGKNVGVLAFNPAIGNAITKMNLCPVEFIWPPYHQIHDFKLRSSFDPFIMTVVKNAQGWLGNEIVGSLERLRDNPATRLELYGGGPPPWSREIAHHALLERMSKALCFYHPKPVDTPGYALMEASLLGVPVLLNKKFFKHTELEFLYKDGETCLTAETYDDVIRAVDVLKDPRKNAEMGRACRHATLDLSSWEKNRGRVARLIQQIT